MKVKYLVLMAMCTALCALGCACEKAQPSGGDSTPTPPSASDEIPEEKPGAPIVSVSQSSVVLCVGESFTLTASAEEIENPVFSWVIDGGAEGDVVALSQTGNTAVITALKIGTTKLVASVKQDGNVFFKTVEITVKEESGVSLVVGNNIGFDNNGYCVQLSTLPTAELDTSIVPLVSVYKNNKLISNVAFSWQSENTDVVKVEDKKLVSMGEGFTYVVGSCVVEEKTYNVRILVEVSRPTIALNESFVVETENLAPLQITSTLGGIAQDVLYGGVSVGEYDMQKKTVTIKRAKLPTYASELGEGKQLIIKTNLADYAVSVDMYTKILRTKEDFDGFAELSKKACSTNAAIWDGYFVLGGDIAYNAQFRSKIADIDSLWQAVEGNWSNGGLYGFRGVFDGKGYNVEGISIDNGTSLGSIFGVLHIDGVVKNVSFTNASVAANSSFVCGAGGGSVENVYVQYASMGAGAQKYEGDGSINIYCSTFFGFKEPTATANVSNCIVDVTNASFNTSTAIKLVGSEYASIKNVFVIGGSKELQKNSNATMSFDEIVDFVEDKNAQTRYQKFDGAFWSLVKGAPIPNALYAKVSGQGIAFVNSATCLVSGTSYKFPVNNGFVKITSDNANVTIQSGIATVSRAVENGDTVKITATSIFDESVSMSITCKLAFVAESAFTDLTANKDTAYYDLTLEKVYFADLAENVTDEVLYYLNADYSMATFGKDGDAAKPLIAVTENRLYKFNCVSVTKVIEKAADLHYLRRDYTVSSYGNLGCYDGKILGTFVLVNDIDCAGITWKDSGSYWENSRGFGGTLDGRGYTISNLTVGKNGFFGAVAYATIKNVNFTGVRLVGKNGDGGYVSLFSTRMFNTLIDNVKIEYAEYTSGGSVHSSSSLMFYETSFDNVITNVTLDISKISGVQYLTECYYNSERPYLSKEKSKYSNITVIVASLDELPVFAYKSGSGTPQDVQEYPEGSFTFELAK